MKRIRIDKETKDYIARILNVSVRMVERSLIYDKNTELAERIRKFAIAKGGLQTVELPEFETIHLCDGTMVQTFPNGSSIRVNMKDGTFELFANGDSELGTINKIEELEALQRRAAGIA